jgi:hypothetical protein
MLEPAVEYFEKQRISHHSRGIAILEIYVLLWRRYQRYSETPVVTTEAPQTLRVA